MKSTDQQLTSTKGQWRLALVFAFAALAAGTLLSGLSMWLVGAVALAGIAPVAAAFNVQLPATLIRLFAVTRTAAKYGERVVGHRAALLDQVARRAVLFAAMAQAPSVREAGWQLGNQDRLADYLEDVDDVDYARLRVSLPSLTLGVASVVLIAATFWLTPMAMAPIGLFTAAILLASRTLLRGGKGDIAILRETTQRASRLLGAIIPASVPLQAEGRWDEVLRESFDHYAEAEARSFALRQKVTLFDAAASLLAPCAMLSVLASAWLAGLCGESLLLPALLAFSWLAFGEPMLGMSKIIVGLARQTTARLALSKWEVIAPSEVVRTFAPDRISSLTLAQLPRRSPDGRLIGNPITTIVRAGRPTALQGPSGCGKTSMLKQIAGWLEGDDGYIFIDGVGLNAQARRSISAFCSHDAAVVSDTVRENLFAPHASDDELWRALRATEMTDRIHAAGGLDGWITQDVLSLGEAQRLNLARAWLSNEPVVLLDEPTEHIDPEQGGRILDTLLQRLCGRIVVVSSHHETIVQRMARIQLA